MEKDWTIIRGTSERETIGFKESEKLREEEREMVIHTFKADGVIEALKTFMTWSHDNVPDEYEKLLQALDHPNYRG